jgi:perosamine synthetase
LALQAYERLEQELAAWARVEPAGMVVCNSGTAALHLALEAFRLPQGAGVLVPDFTMVACARAVTLAGLTPVLVDCKEDLLMDEGLFGPLVGDWKEATDSDVAVIMAVHLYGRTAPIVSYLDACVRRNPYVVEDLAEAHGVRPHPETDAACWSFYRNKVVHGEEGGAVWFRDPAHADLARQLRCQGFTAEHDFVHVPRGHNYRMPNCCAELVSWSLLNVHNETFLRRRVEAWYDAHCPDEWRMPARDVPWVYDVRVPGLTRDAQKAAVRELNELGVAARMSFTPLHLQPEYLNAKFVTSRDGCRSTLLSNWVLYLPLTGVDGPADAERCFNVLRKHAPRPA